MSTLTLDVAAKQQVTGEQIKHFDDEARALIAGYHEAGWRSHMSTKGHVILQAPDGEETAAVSRDSLRGRSGRNAAAPLKRWRRRIEQEQATKGNAPGSAFGIEDLDKARRDPFSEIVPARTAKVMSSHPQLMSYIVQNVPADPKVMAERLHIGLDKDHERPWDAWVVIDHGVVPPVLVAHGDAYTWDDAVNLARQEGQLPREEPTVAAQPTTTPDTYACPEEGCDKTFDSEDGLRLHVGHHRGYDCPECGEHFGHPRTLGTHRRKAHGVEAGKKKLAADPGMCRYCFRVYASPQGRSHHESVAHAGQQVPPVGLAMDDPNACDVCGKTFESRGGLSSHYRMHKDKGEQPWDITAGPPPGAEPRVRKKPAAGAQAPAEAAEEPKNAPVATRAVTAPQEAAQEPASAPDLETGDVPVTSPGVDVSQVLATLPEGADAQDMVAAIRSIVTPPLVSELQACRAERDRLQAENEVLSGQLSEMNARMDILKEAMGI